MVMWLNMTFIVENINAVDYAKESFIILFGDGTNFIFH